MLPDDDHPGWAELLAACANVLWKEFTALPETGAQVCAVHPWEDFPHGACDGPGAPEMHRRYVLEDALAYISKEGAFGSTAAQRWLSGHGICWDLPAGWVKNGGSF